MHYAFFDEFGGVSNSSEDPVLVVASVVTTTPRNLDLIIKREYRNLGASRVMGELKASRSDQKVIRRVLAAIVAQDAVKGLQVADFVAWAMGQKHQRGDDRYWALIEDRVVAEVVIAVK